MIRTEAVYHEAKGLLARERKRAAEHHDRLRAMSLGAEDDHRAIAAWMSLPHQFAEEPAE